MEDLETRKARRIEQMVTKWLRRSRDNSARGRASVGDRQSDGNSQPTSSIKLRVDIQRDELLGHYGFEVSQNPPLLITSVAPGSAADGKLLPGDHILAINGTAVKDVAVTGGQTAARLRELEGSVQLTVLRCISGPKSSFLTAEKRARLKTNPVKVRFAEEVVVNGHTQGSSLLCMPNVLKVYLENGQTKAFKFEANTTVKDIILTLREKLSIRSIDHFALVLEEQYNVLKTHLLHEEELIEEVVQRKESHDYRCLFRVYFMPRDPLDLLEQDLVTFEYLYLQSCSDVLQERFAVEMKCSVALRLAALHIQERMIACSQPHKVSLKYIEKDWGIENFISPTLLRNMRGKDIKKTISFHMKRNQLLLDPRQKYLRSATQVRLCYLQILGDLKLYGGKIFNATLMLQDRESCIALLVGAKYGISQVVNNKLNIITMLAEFTNISRLELTEESDQVSMVKIYLQDIKLLTLLLESNSAKDLACLIAGYYRLLVDANSSIFAWTGRERQTHRFSAEEGYESRTGSDSDESSEPDFSLDRFSDIHSPKHSTTGPLREEGGELEKDRKTPGEKETIVCNGQDNANDSLSEASDSANTESRGFKTSGSSDSMDALEEDDLEACSSSRPEIFHFYTPSLQELNANDKVSMGIDDPGHSPAMQEDFFSFSPPPYTPNPALSQSNVQFRKENEINTSPLESKLAENNIMEYYSLCSNISPASSGEKNTGSVSPERGSLQDLSREPSGDEAIFKGDAQDLHLAPPLMALGDVSSDDEFYDATERMTPTEARAGSGSGAPHNMQDSVFLRVPSRFSLGENIPSRQSGRAKHNLESKPRCANSLRKRRSFLQTNYTSQVTFPLSSENADGVCHGRESGSSKSPAPLSDLMELEPDQSEMKSVLDPVAFSISAVCLQGAQTGAESSDLIVGSSSAEKYDRSFITPSSSPQSSRLSTSKISLQLKEVDKVCKEKAENLTEAFCGAGTKHKEMELPEKVLGPQNPPLETGVSYVLIEEIIHTTTKPSQSLVIPRGKQLPSGPVWDADPFPTEKMEKHGQLAVVSYERVKDDPAFCESSQALEDSQLKGNITQTLKEDCLRTSENRKRLSFSNSAEPLSDCADVSAIATCFSRLSLRSKVGNGEITQKTEEKHQRIMGHNVPAANQISLKEDSLLSDVLRSAQHRLSAVDTSQNVCLANNQTTGQKDLRDLYVDYKYAQPGLRTSLSMENVKQTQMESNRSDCVSRDILCNSEGSNEERSVSNRSFLRFNGTEFGKAPVSGKVGSPILMRTKETISPKHKTAKCSCQLTYVSCFGGLDNEAGLEDPKPVVCDISEGPLTTQLTRSAQSLDFHPRRPIQEYNYVNGNPNDEKPIWFSDSAIDALSRLKNRPRTLPLDFRLLLENVGELQEILRLFGGQRTTHSQDECSAHFSENKNTLGTESQRLMSSCQKVIRTYRPSLETHAAIRETFRNLLQLSEVCFQFTNCGLCTGKHKQLTTNIQGFIQSYRQFIQAAQPAGGKGHPCMSRKLICQYSALTASLFCLLQQFRT